VARAASRQAARTAGVVGEPDCQTYRSPCEKILIAARQVRPMSAQLTGQNPDWFVIFNQFKTPAGLALAFSLHQSGATCLS